MALSEGVWPESARRLAEAVSRSCAVCRGSLARKPTGRPRLTCSDRCRQAKKRLSRNSRAETVLLAHGFNGQRLLNLCHRIAWDELRRRGGFPGNRHEDLIGFLAGAGCAAALRYDPARRQSSYGKNGGELFASYLADILAKRVLDYFRCKREGFVDRRYNPAGSPMNHVGERLDVLIAARGDEAEEMLVTLELDAAAAELGEGLSVDARWTLERLACPMAGGATTNQAGLEAGITVFRAKRHLEELREELAA